MTRRSRPALTGEHGNVVRALLWLATGVAVFVAVIALITPELVWGADDAGRAVLGELAVLVGIAAVPGLLVVLATIRHRRRRDRQE
jgi:hypothetical protein